MVHKWLTYCFDKNFNLPYERTQSPRQKPEISPGAVWDFFEKNVWVLKNSMDLELVSQGANGIVTRRKRTILRFQNVMNSNTSKTRIV